MTNAAKKQLFGIQIDATTMKEILLVIEKRIRCMQATHILGINADKINELKKDKTFYPIVQKAEVVHADGVSILLASKFLGKHIPERIAGIDLMQELLDLAAEKKYRVYFLGAKQEVLDKLRENIHSKWPKLEIVGMKNGYFSEDEWQSITSEIQQCNPQLVFVGITSPKKEYLIDYMMKNGLKTVFMGVGGSFDVLAGEIKRAPLWIQKCYLEWAFRMSQEPKRLFKRYTFNNIKFIILMIKEKFNSIDKK